MHISSSFLCDDLNIFQGTLILQTLPNHPIPNSLSDDLDIFQGTLILQTLITLILTASYVMI